MTTLPEASTSTPQSVNLSTPSMNSVDKLSAKDQKRLVSWVLTEYERAKNDRWKTERQWYLNLAFYFGKQNVLFKGGREAVGKGFELYTPPAPYWRARPVVNKIKPRIRKEMSKLTSQKPNAYIIPASSDDRDMYAAQAGEQIWQSIYISKKVHSKIRRAVFWTSITGNGFLKEFWNPNAIDRLTGEVGDLDMYPVMPMRLFVPDLLEEEIENQPFVFEATKRNIDQLSRQYQQNFVADVETKTSEFENSFMTLMDADQDKNKEVIVIEAWIKPGQTKILPAGGLITIANNKILQYIPDGWPYDHNMYPYAHIGHIPTGKFYRDATITDLIPLQREYNRTRGQIIESKNRMAKPQLAAEQGSLDTTKITNEPGLIVQYKPGFQAPTPIPLQNLPAYVLQEQDRIQMDMDEISGQHEISRGQTPSGVTAATAISFLQEQDDTQLSYTYDSLEEATEKVAKMTLAYVKQYWTEPRMVKVTGSDGSFDVKAFRGSDLGDNTDIRIEAGSALPTSKAAKQAFIFDLMKMGFIPPEKGLEVMEMGGVNKIYETLQVDIRQAQRENLKMERATAELIQQNQNEQLQIWAQENPGVIESGLLLEDGQGNFINLAPAVDPATGQETGLPPEPVELALLVPVNSWDNHAIHIEEHNKYRKSQSFENLPDEAKALFEEHVSMHIFMMQNALMDPTSHEAITTGMEMPVADEEGASGEESGASAEEVLMEEPAASEEMPPIQE